ncbi:MAG: hypothetical protein HQ594_01420, partial [Candidatus Omnitrophica bacterium]|nr:hypothetical protein [Candidatus Omnitrophota bacterium]
MIRFINTFKLYIKIIAAVLVCVFAITSIPCIDSAHALAVYAGTQRVAVRREMLDMAMNLYKITYLASGDPELKSSDLVLLPYGKLLVSSEYEDKPLELLRLIYNRETKAIIQIMSDPESDERDECIRVQERIFAGNDIITSYRRISGVEVYADRETLFKDVIAKAFELLLLEKHGAISRKEMSREERRFLKAIKPVILEKENEYFTGIFWSQYAREKRIRVALANGVELGSGNHRSEEGATTEGSPERSPELVEGRSRGRGNGHGAKEGETLASASTAPTASNLRDEIQNGAQDPKERSIFVKTTLFILIAGFFTTTAYVLAVHMSGFRAPGEIFGWGGSKFMAFARYLEGNTSAFVIFYTSFVFVANVIASRFDKKKHWTRFATVTVLAILSSRFAISKYVPYIQEIIPDVGVYSHWKRPLADLLGLAQPMIAISFLVMGFVERLRTAWNKFNAFKGEHLKGTLLHVLKKLKLLYEMGGFYQVAILFWSPIIHFSYYEEGTTGVVAPVSFFFAIVAAVYLVQKPGQMLTPYPILNKVLKNVYLAPLIGVTGLAMFANEALAINAGCGLFTTAVLYIAYILWRWIPYRILSFLERKVGGVASAPPFVKNSEGISNGDNIGAAKDLSSSDGTAMKQGTGEEASRDRKVDRLKELTGRNDIKHVRDVDAVLKTIDDDPLDTIYLVDELPDDEQEERFRRYFRNKYEVGYSLTLIDGVEYFIVWKSNFNEVEDKESGSLGSVSTEVLANLADHRIPFFVHLHHLSQSILPSVADYIKPKPLPYTEPRPGEFEIPDLIHVGRFYMGHPDIGFVEYYYDEDLDGGIMAPMLESEDIQLTCVTGTDATHHQVKTEEEALDILLREIDKGCWAFDVNFGSGFCAGWRKDWKFSDIVKGRCPETAEDIVYRLMCDALNEQKPDTSAGAEATEAIPSDPTTTSQISEKSLAEHPVTNSGEISNGA